MPTDNRNKLPLRPGNARRIIENLFDQKNQWDRNELIAEVKRIHAERGGLEGNQDPGAVVTKALNYLQADGKVRNTDYGRWERAEDEGADVVERPQIAASQIIAAQTGQHPEGAPRAEKEIGTGPEKVYVYFNPNDRKLAAHEGRRVWECKVGCTGGDVSGRIRQQGTRTALSREPVIGLVINTEDSAALEKALHNSLRLIDALVPDRVGDEWFYTSPDYIEKWFHVFQECLRHLDSDEGA